MRKNAKIKKVVGKRIQKARKESGLSQEQLSEKVRISRVYMGYIEQGRNIPTLDLVITIAKALKIPTSELID
jgi:transcriptional regulator with XRE-family HTH domain